MSYSGIFCPVITPFREDQSIDTEAVGRLYEHLISGDVSGIVILGSLGEFQRLTVSNKHELIDFAVKHIHGRCKVIVGTGGTAMRDVLELTEYVASAGADAAMLIPPYYFPLSDEGVYTYYSEVAKNIDIDLLLYNFPARTGYELSVDVIRRLAETCPSIVGIKDTVDSISHTRAVIQDVHQVRPGFAVLSGFDEYLYPNLLCGGAGTVNGLTNVMPGLFRDAYRAFEDSDLEACSIFQKRIADLMPIYAVSTNFVGAIKYATSTVIPGVRPACRLPEAELSEDEQRRIDQILATDPVNRAT